MMDERVQSEIIIQVRGSPTSLSNSVLPVLYRPRLTPGEAITELVSL